MGATPNQPFEIFARRDSNSQYIEIATGGRIEIFGRNGIPPAQIALVSGGYAFDQRDIDMIRIQTMRAAQPLFAVDLNREVQTALNGLPVDYTNEQLIIAVLVRMLGGVVTISDEEIKEVNKTTKLDAVRADFVGHPRMKIEVKPR